jgi:hypothetical protein
MEQLHYTSRQLTANDSPDLHLIIYIFDRYVATVSSFTPLSIGSQQGLLIKSFSASSGSAKQTMSVTLASDAKIKNMKSQVVEDEFLYMRI